MDAVMVVVIFGAAVAGFVQGLSGSNFGLVAMAIWAWVLDPTLTGPLVVCGSLTGQLLAAGALRKQLDVSRLWPMVAGGVVGVPVGVVLLHQVDPVLFRLLVGILLALWCPLMLFSSRLPRIEGGGRLGDAGVGVLGGIMGGLGGLSGPAPALWAVLKGWDRHTQRGVIQGFNLAMQASTMLAYLLSGTITTRVLGLFALVVLAVIVPTLLGVRLYHGLSDQTFRRVVLGSLMVSGWLLIGLSVPKLF